MEYMSLHAECFIDTSTWLRRQNALDTELYQFAVELAESRMSHAAVLAGR